MKRQSMLVTFGVLCLVGTLAATAAGVQAQTPTGVTDDDVNRIASQLYCPVCENVALEVCPTEACARWREAIREKLAAGWSDQQIMDNFVELYGARVIGTPPKAGFSLMLYVVPPVAAVALAVGAYFILRMYRKGKTAPVTPASAAGRPSEGYRKKLMDDIDKDV